MTPNTKRDHAAEAYVNKHFNGIFGSTIYRDGYDQGQKDLRDEAMASVELNKEFISICSGYGVGCSMEYQDHIRLDEIYQQSAIREAALRELLGECVEMLTTVNQVNIHDINERYKGLVGVHLLSRNHLINAIVKCRELKKKINAALGKGEG